MVLESLKKAAMKDGVTTVQRIKDLIRTQKITQSHFSRLINCSEVTVNRWLNGRVNISPSWETLVNLKIDELASVPSHKTRKRK